MAALYEFFSPTLVSIIKIVECYRSKFLGLGLLVSELLDQHLWTVSVLKSDTGLLNEIREPVKHEEETIRLVY